MNDKSCITCAFANIEYETCNLGGYFENPCKYHITCREYIKIVDSNEAFLL